MASMSHLNTASSSVRSLCLTLVLGALLAGCGSKISGDYGGPNCFYDKFSFKSGGVVHVSFGPGVFESTYSVDGDKVTVVDKEGKVIPFTKNGDSLEGEIVGQKITCTKL
jgi:hypothetical protein